MNAVVEINAYCTAVLNSTIKTGRWERAAVQRYLDDLKRAREDGCPIYFDQSKAERALKLFPLLEHTTGKFNGQPFELEPWQKFIIWNLYGWYRTDDRTRRFRKFYVEIGRKNGKTALAAAICHLEFSFVGESRPEVYCVATKRAQSKLVWEEAYRMRGRSNFLRNRITATPSEYTMKEPGGGIFKALGGDGGGDDGLNPSVVIFDELHEFKNKGHMDLWDKMHTGSDMRTQPVFGYITTAGDKESELWKKQRAYAEQVATGEVFDDSLFSFICALDPDDDEFDPDNWRKANPGLDTIKKRSGIEELAAKARHDPIAHNQLLRYHCNRVVESVNQFIPLRIWDLGNKPLPTLSGRLCHGAADLGWRDDLASFALVFPPLDDLGDWYVKVWAFIPEDCRRDLTKLPFVEWVKSGQLTVTQGNTTDTGAIHSVIKEASEIYNLKSIGLDGNNAREFGTDLTAKGFVVDEIGQQATHYNEPMRKLLELCTSGRFIHAGDSLLRWCIGNMVSKTANGLVRPDKENSREKIDPAVATVMGVRQCLFSDDPTKQSRIRVVTVG